MSYFTHSQRRGTLSASLGSAALAALLLVLPFAPAAHSGVPQSECNANLGFGRVAWDSASGSCVVLDELILLVPSIEKAKEELAKDSGWTVMKELNLVGVLIIKHSTQLTLDQLKTHKATFDNADWTSIVDLNAIATIASPVPVEDPIDDDGSTAVSVSPLALPLESPQDLAVVAGHERLSLRWAASADSATITGYQVQWKAGDEDYDAETRQFTTVGTDTTITGLTNDVEYAVRVRATQDGNNHSDWTDEQQALPRGGGNPVNVK